MKSPLLFSVLYICFLLPTYILPLLGSNSSFILMGNGGIIQNSLTLIHISCLLVLILISYLRSRETGAKKLASYAILAAVFDLTPVLSFIPLVPTFFHFLTLLMGNLNLIQYTENENNHFGNFYSSVNNQRRTGKEEPEYSDSRETYYQKTKPKQPLREASEVEIEMKLCSSCSQMISKNSDSCPYCKSPQL